MDATNDNHPAPILGGVRIIGHVGEGGRVTVTDPAWRPAPRPAPELVEIPDGRTEP